MGMAGKKVPLEMFWLYVDSLGDILFITDADKIRRRSCIELLQKAFIPHESCDIYL